MMGAREFLFLWSKCKQDNIYFPGALNAAHYNAHHDTISLGPLPGATFKVNREGSESCDILKKHGFTQDDIDAAVKKYLEDT
jgi:hypothetical protein